MRRLFYTCPVDSRDLAAWGPLADALRGAVQASCGSGVTVEVGDQPVWGRGVDEEETLAELEEMQPMDRARIDLWSAVPGHAALAITLGSQVQRKARRALEKKLRKVLRGQKLLRELEGRYDDESARVFAFDISVADDAAARTALEFLVSPFDPPLYLGERWLLQGEDESLDAVAFDLIAEPAPGLVTFFCKTEQAEERVWRHAGSGEGLFALYPDDPALPDLIRRFHKLEDLRILLAEKPDAGQRITVDRRASGETGDGLVVAYTTAGPPEIESPYLFLI